MRQSKFTEAQIIATPADPKNGVWQPQTCASVMVASPQPSINGGRSMAG